MTKNIKFFLIALILSLPIWWGVNLFGKNVEEFAYLQEITKNPQILTAQLTPPKNQISTGEPIINPPVENLDIKAKSAISVLVDSKNNQKIIFEKETDKKLPIASLTKLMTAEIALEYYDPSQMIEISKDAVQKEGDFGNLKIGEIFDVKSLLYPVLMESSNDAAYALSELISEKSFVVLMNIKAKELGMENTFFVNVTGLDPDNPGGEINYSTAKDLVKLTAYLLKNQPIIWEIISLPEFNLYTPDGVFHHKVINNNELLKDGLEVLGGKTGWTPEAQGCLVLVSKAPKNQGYLINVILGSEDRFGEMKNLLEWANKNFR